MSAFNLWSHIFSAGFALLVALSSAGAITQSDSEAEPARLDVMLERVTGDAPVPAGSELTLTSWNIGYAALGADADFLADGGGRLRASSRAEIARNSAAIASHLAGLDSDLLLIQEAAGPGFMTRGEDVRGQISSALAGRDLSYSADVRADFFFLRFDHGLMSASRLGVDEAFILRTVDEPGAMMGLIPRRYHIHCLRLEGDVPWSIINLHLAAFDTDAAVRRAQLARILDFAVSEHAAGRHVVIGGDFNLRLTPSDFAHTTDAADYAWLHDFPAALLPEGWAFGADPRTPSVRTLERPYAAGDNYAAVIDGFILSPNVALMSVETEDLAFEHSDHQPVTIRVRAR